MNYAKIVKFVMWALLAIGVAIIGYGVFAGLESSDGLPIDMMLFWAYALIAIAVLAIVIIGIAITAKNGSKGLVKLAAVVLGAVAIVAVAYLLAPGNDAVGLVSANAPDAGTLKLTDTVLILTFLACGASVITILFSAIFNAIRK